MIQDRLFLKPFHTKPVSHYSNHCWPTCWLSESIYYPNEQVKVSVIEAQPLSHHTEHKERESRCSHANKENVSQIETIAQYATNK